METQPVLISGAGLAGPTLAYWLARAGLRPTLIEQAPSLRTGGYVIDFWGLGYDIADRMGLSGDLDRLGYHIQEMRIVDDNGERETGFGTNVFRELTGGRFVTVRRSDLTRLLFERANPVTEMIFGDEISGLEQNRDGVTVTFHRASSRRYDLVIGADGLRSYVRQRLHADALRFSGRTAWRATIEAARVPVAMRRKETNLWLGRKAHLVHYPLRGGAIVNVVAIVDEDFHPDEKEFWSSPGEPGFLEARFVRWDKTARDLLRAALAWQKWPLADRNPAASFVAGRVALMGDAAHPMLPFLAQGAAQAIEDAGVLGEVLARGQTIEAGLLAYQEKRLPRAVRVQKESRRQATIYHLGGPAAFLRDAALRALGPEKMLARYDWLYDAHIAKSHQF